MPESPRTSCVAPNVYDTETSGGPGRYCPAMPWGARIRLAVVLMAVGAVLLTGCTQIGDAGSRADSCADRAPAALPEGTEPALTLVPASARPGETFVAHYPERKARDRSLTMTSGGTPGCIRHFLITGRQWDDVSGEEEIVTMFIPQARRTVPGIVPTSADPGVYVVCGDPMRLCALLTVTR